MLTANNLERTGKLGDFPAVELFYQARADDLSGTFRLAHNQLKTAVYFDNGKIVYAATNARSARLGVKLVQSNLLQSGDLNGWQELPDVELGAKLVASGKLTEMSLRFAQNQLSREIVGAALDWTTGDWAFSPLVRVREELRGAVELIEMLVSAARKLPVEFVCERFGGDELESIAPTMNARPTFDLTPEEGFVWSRIEGLVNCRDFAAIVGLPDAAARKAVYALWLGGLLRRFNHRQAFDQNTINHFRGARLKLRQPAAPILVAEPLAQSSTIAAAADKSEKPETVAATPTTNGGATSAAAETLEDYLARVEAARTHYQIFNVAETAAASDIKTAYFRVAKQFHPDKFHTEVGSETHTRLQNAFTRVAAAYEVLKDQKSRELYDFKLNKESAAPAPDEAAQFKPDLAFAEGMKALGAGDFAQAVAFLNRAVQLAPEVAEYHARLGQALAVNPKFRHKAETEFQKALKLDEKNPEWRLVLAEFYLLVGLNKRAETELNRLLVHDPDHAPALAMLAKTQT